MRVVDERHWAEQKAALRSDEQGREYIDLVQELAEIAEACIDAGVSAREGFFAALEQVEKRGILTSSLIGQVLISLAAHWKYGEDLSKELSPIELRLATEHLAIQIARLAQTAAESSGEVTST